MQVAEVLHQHKRRVLLLVSEGRIVGDVTQGTATCFPALCHSLDQVIDLRFVGLNAGIQVQGPHILIVVQ
jgi:hypothetical protein